MRIYSKSNVYEKSLERIEWVIREFKGRVIVTHSGGKDSTTVFELTREVVHKLKSEGFLQDDYKIKVLWLDQEAEWTRTREHIEYVASQDDVEMYWSQVHFELSHSGTLGEMTMLDVYNPEYEGTFCQPLSELAYDKMYVDASGEPISIDELNKHRKLVDGRWVYDTELAFRTAPKRFTAMFDALYSWIGNGASYGILQGIKASESPRRSLQVTYQLGYKGITWSSLAGLESEHVRFSPIYDWSRTDNFTYFAQRECVYNKLYDEFLQFGISPAGMRVSSLIHETSVGHNATIVQELDRELYNRMVDRLPGISTYSQLQDEMQKVELPPAFMDYEEYARYLIDNVTVEKNRKYFLSMFESKFYKENIDNIAVKTEVDRVIVQSILTKDIDKTKYTNKIVAMENEIRKREKYGQ